MLSLCELFGIKFCFDIWHNGEFFRRAPWTNWHRYRNRHVRRRSSAFELFSPHLEHNRSLSLVARTTERFLRTVSCSKLWIGLHLRRSSRNRSFSRIGNGRKSGQEKTAPLRGAGTRRPSFGLGIRRVHHPPLASRRRMLKAQSRRSDLSVQELKYSSIQETGDRPAALSLLCFLASRVLEFRPISLLLLPRAICLRT